MMDRQQELNLRPSAPTLDAMPMLCLLSYNLSILLMQIFQGYWGELLAAEPVRSSYRLTFFRHQALLLGSVVYTFSSCCLRKRSNIPDRV